MKVKYQGETLRASDIIEKISFSPSLSLRMVSGVDLNRTQVRLHSKYSVFATGESVA